MSFNIGDTVRFKANSKDLAYEAEQFGDNNQTYTVVDIDDDILIITSDLTGKTSDGFEDRFELADFLKTEPATVPEQLVHDQRLYIDEDGDKLEITRIGGYIILGINGEMVSIPEKDAAWVLSHFVDFCYGV